MIFSISHKKDPGKIMTITLSYEKKEYLSMKQNHMLLDSNWEKDHEMIFTNLIIMSFFLNS